MKYENIKLPRWVNSSLEMKLLAKIFVDSIHGSVVGSLEDFLEGAFDDYFFNKEERTCEDYDSYEIDRAIKVGLRFAEKREKENILSEQEET